MARIKVNWEIGLKDIIHILLAIIGGIFTFYLVNSINTKNDTLRTKQILINEIVDLYPNMKMHYTNQFTANKDTLKIRVFMKNESKHPIFYTSPSLYLISHNDTLQYYKSPNLGNYFGIISPNQEMRIEYETYDYSKDSIPERINMKYSANIDQKLANTYADLLSEAIETMNDNNINWITNKDYYYAEKTYASGKNDIWHTFFENPR